MNNYPEGTRDYFLEILRKHLENETGLVVFSGEKWRELFKSMGDEEIQKISQRKIDIRDNFWKKVFSFLNISETYFNRDPDQVHSIFEEVITHRLSSLVLKDKSVTSPSSVELPPNTLPFSAWSAGCSRGEEAYTLAIHLQALKESKFPGLDWKVWGTDIQESSIEWAKKGRYEKYSFRASFTEDWNRYWETYKGDLIIHQDIAKKVNFEVGNLLKPSPRKYDLIFCRNVLIYISEEKKRIILENLINALKPGAILVTGHSELGSLLHDSLEAKHIRNKTTYYTLVSPCDSFQSQKIKSLGENFSTNKLEKTIFARDENKTDRNESPEKNSKIAGNFPKHLNKTPKAEETQKDIIIHSSSQTNTNLEKIRYYKERIYMEPGDLEAYYEIASLYWEIRERELAKSYQNRARFLVKNNPSLVDRWIEGNTWKGKWEAFLNVDL